MASKSLTGSCACGACHYTYSSTEGPQHLDFCYCTMCQQSSGAPFMAWMGISRTSLKLHGPIMQFSLSSVATRTFCATCGSKLTLQYDCYPEKTHLAAATVDIDKSEWDVPKASVHIFVRSCPKWYPIPEDGVARWEEFDDDFESRFPEVVAALKVS